jgi:N-acetylglutamate synthase
VSLPTEYTLRPFAVADYSAAHALWRRTEGMGLGESDSESGITQFLARNPELSSVVVESATGGIVGTVLAGHDGRRGYLHHLAVEATHRKRGLGRALVDESLSRLRRAGITRANIFLYATNEAGRAFWLHEGWRLRDDLVLMQKVQTCCQSGC